MARTWLLTACLVVGAGAVAWPTGTARRRWLVRGTRGEGPSTGRPPMPWVSALVPLLSTAAAVHPHRLAATTAAGAGLAGWVAGGPVAALTVGAYAALGARAAVRRTVTRRAATARAAALDDVSALVADLRAGLPPSTISARSGPGLGTSVAVDPGSAARLGVTSGVRPGPGPGAAAGRNASGAHTDERVTALSAAVWRLAERTGAPAADLLERVEADARTADRARDSAAAQAAGARATALLLAALPAGGIALGYGIGVDPLRVLLHTPLGAGCAAGTVLLQVAGLAWAARLAGGPAR
jgi:tight adherence protein B